MIRRVLNHELVKNSGIYLGFSLIIGLISFFVLPVLSHYFSKEDVGIIGMFNVIYLLMTPVLGLSMNSIIARSFFTRKDISSLIGNGVVFSTISFLLFLIIILLLPQSVFLYFEIPKFVVIIALAASYGAINTAVFSTLLQMQRKAYKWGIIAISGLLINIGLTFIILFSSDLTYESRIIGVVFSTIISSVIGFLLVNSSLKISFKYNPEHYKYFFKLGTPLIVVALSAWGIISIDKILIQSIISIEIVGVYVMANSLSSIMNQLITAFSRAWAPFAYKYLAENKHISLFKITMLVFLVFVIIAIVISTVGIYFFKLLIDEKFYESLTIVPILISSYTFSGLYKLIAPYALHIEKTLLISKITFAGLLINLILNYFLIKEIGIAGAAYASLLAYALMSVLLLIFMMKEYKLNFFKQKQL